MKWGELKFIYKIGFPAIIAALFGLVAFLFSDQFVSYLKFKQSINCGLPQNWLLLVIILSFLIYLLGWFVFNVYCPPAIKMHANFEDFKKQKKSDYDDWISITKNNLRAVAVTKIQGLNATELSKVVEILLEGAMLSEPIKSSPLYIAEKSWRDDNIIKWPQRYICVLCLCLSVVGLIFVVCREMLSCV